MERTLAFRLMMVVLIVVTGLALTFAIDDSQSLASESLPGEGIVAAGQSQGLFYVATAETLFVSRNGRQWEPLPLPDDSPLQAVTMEAGGTLYLATEEGLYQTDSAGGWERLDLPLDSRVTVLVADPVTPGQLFAATEEGSIYRIGGEGRAPRQIASARAAGTIRDLAFLPGEELPLLVATDGGLFRVEAGGKRWQQVRNVPAINDLLLLPSNPPILLAGSQNSALLRSSDGGSSWEVIHPAGEAVPGSSLAITALSYDPETAGLLYVATAHLLGHTERHLDPAALYLSADGGMEWTRIGEMSVGAAPVIAILPPQFPGGGVRAVTREGMDEFYLEQGGTLEALRAGTPAQRIRAAKLLSVTALPSQAEALLPHLADEDPQVGYYVARALGRIGGERVTRTLVETLEADAPTIVKLRALMALGMIGDPATIPALATAFRDETLAQSAASALASIDDEAAWELLTASLNDQGASQRRAALAVLEANSGAALAPLLDRLEDRDPAMRAAALEALGWGGQPAAIPAIRELLDDPVGAVRVQATFALGELGDQASVERLRQMARTDDDGAVRQAASQAALRASEERPARPPSTARPELRLSTGPSTGIAWLKTFILTLTAALVILVLAARPGSQPATLA